MNVNKDFIQESKFVKENIVEANLQTENVGHSMICNGRATYTTDDLTYISKEEAEIALNLGIKLGYRAPFEEHHGSWEGYYSFHPVIKKENLDYFYEHENLYRKFGINISIDPVYDLAKTSLKSSDLKVLIKENLELAEKSKDIIKKQFLELFENKVNVEANTHEEEMDLEP